MVRTFNLFMDFCTSPQGPAGPAGTIGPLGEMGLSVGLMPDWSKNFN